MPQPKTWFRSTIVTRVAPDLTSLVNRVPASLKLVETAQARPVHTGAELADMSCWMMSCRFMHRQAPRSTPAVRA
jgi:hypothetical protein